MELSQEEKDRIVAQEKFRFETVQQLKTQAGGGSCGVHGKTCNCGCHGHGFGMGCHRCHCGGFWKGLILGLILSAIFGLFCHRHYYGHGDGRCYYGSPMTQDQAPSESPKN